MIYLILFSDNNNKWKISHTQLDSIKFALKMSKWNNLQLLEQQTYKLNVRFLTLSYSSEGSPALAVFRHNFTPNCIKLTIPGFPYPSFLYLVVTLDTKKS